MSEIQRYDNRGYATNKPLYEDDLVRYSAHIARVRELEEALFKITELTQKRQPPPPTIINELARLALRGAQAEAKEG